jgi:RNA polymerase sigma-70 factor (ECF subfamily)
VLGLLALIRLHRARDPARFDACGRLVLLRDQDRSVWDRSAISPACALPASAGRLRRPGPYQIQAAIVARHAEAPSWEATDWQQILALCDALLAFVSSPVASLNRAIAAEARLADDHALALTSNAAERSLLEQRLS